MLNDKSTFRLISTKTSVLKEKQPNQLCFHVQENNVAMHGVMQINGHTIYIILKEYKLDVVYVI